MKIIHVLLTLICLWLLPVGSVASQDLAAADLEAVRQAASAYAAAWLTNDADSVMATFVDEPVLSPSGLPFLEGQAAARNFWFPPDSPATTVTRFDMRQIEVSGSGSLAYARGTYHLAFEFDGASYENSGKYLTILRKGADGTWRITHHIWDDFPRTE